MTESLVPNCFDAGRKATAVVMSPRSPHLRVGMAARAAAAAPTALRTGPSRAAAGAMLQKALAAVDMRLVNALCSLPNDSRNNVARVEVALLARLDRSLRGHLDALAADVVLCDSLAEFAESVHAVLQDLETGEAPRYSRLLAFLREMLSEVVAHKSAQVQPLKQKLNRSRAMLAQASLGGGNHLWQVMQSTCLLYNELFAELERLCPRGRSVMLDELLRMSP